MQQRTTTNHAPRPKSARARPPSPARDLLRHTVPLPQMRVTPTVFYDNPAVLKRPSTALPRRSSVGHRPITRSSVPDAYPTLFMSGHSVQRQLEQEYAEMKAKCLVLTELNDRLSCRNVELEAIAAVHSAVPAATMPTPRQHAAPAAACEPSTHDTLQLERLRHEPSTRDMMEIEHLRQKLGVEQEMTRLLRADLAKLREQLAEASPQWTGSRPLPAPAKAAVVCARDEALAAVRLLEADGEGGGEGGAGESAGTGAGDLPPGAAELRELAPDLAGVLASKAGRRGDRPTGMVRGGVMMTARVRAPEPDAAAAFSRLVFSVGSVKKASAALAASGGLGRDERADAGSAEGAHAGEESSPGGLAARVVSAEVRRAGRRSPADGVAGGMVGGGMCAAVAKLVVSSDGSSANCELAVPSEGGEEGGGGDGAEAEGAARPIEVAVGLHAF